MYTRKVQGGSIMRILHVFILSPNSSHFTIFFVPLFLLKKEEKMGKDEENKWEGKEISKKIKRRERDI